MWALKTELKKAEETKNDLIKRKLMDPEYLPLRKKDYIYFPLNKKIKWAVNLTLPKKEKNLTIKEILNKELTKKELAWLPHSQERVGNILILEIPPELEKKEKIIAWAFLKSNPSVKTIVKKEKAHQGEFRLRTVKVLAGEKIKETIHHENKIQLKINLEKTYFSARLANERLRIASLIKRPEIVMVMFSGAGPYLLVIAKNSPAKLIYGIEINPFAHRLALENVKLNKLEKKICLREGDVRDWLPKIKQKFDRIIMPLPKTGESFLPLALTKAKPKAIIHFYAFIEEKEGKKEAEKIKQICKKENHPVRIIKLVKCGQFSPTVSRFCFDLEVG